MSISRRQFLETTALGSLAGPVLAAKGELPTRTLGKTGAKVSILAFGSGSRFLMYKPDDKAVEALNRALDLGITYVDTAIGYGNGKSEELVGHVMRNRRKEVFLATKVQKRNGDAAMRDLEASMKRLQTDRLDLMHIHSLGDDNDLAAIEAPDGVLNALRKLRDQKVTRFIGITCHDDPAVLKKALERHDFDCTQMALNAGRVGSPDLRRGMDARAELTGKSFEDMALPVARKKNLGVIAMKVFGQDHLVGKVPTNKLMYYPLSLEGVHVAVAGMPKLEMLEENVANARAFKPLSKAELAFLPGALTEEKLAMDQFFRGHVDA